MSNIVTARVGRQVKHVRQRERKVLCIVGLQFSSDPNGQIIQAKATWFDHQTKQRTLNTDFGFYIIPPLNERIYMYACVYVRAYVRMCVCVRILCIL